MNLVGKEKPPDNLIYLWHTEKQNKGVESITDNKSLALDFKTEITKHSRRWGKIKR